MRVPISWLREFTDIQLTPEQLADALMLRGLEVQGLERWGGHWGAFVVGELLEVGPHPRADRLQVTKVRVGAGEVLNVVCGARNIAAGQRVPVALVGAKMPDGRTIERAEKMGVASEGMLCSGEELHATDDGDGILILDPTAPPGTRLVDWLGEDVLDIDVKPNRGDLLSIYGLAREVAGITGAPLRRAPRTLVEAHDDAGDGLRLEVAVPADAPRVVLRVVEGLSVAPAPDAIQMRLKAAGLRSVSNVVDATNYIMLELGKPTHAFDRARVGASLRVRRAAAGERLETLDHSVRELAAEDLVIADERAPLALAGVMGGASSEVSPETTAVIVESAIFDPTLVRKSAQRHALRSEASHRFERGQEWELAVVGADEVSALLASWAGGRIRRGRLDSAPAPLEPQRRSYRPERARRLIGSQIGDAEQIALLGRIGIAGERGKGEGRVEITAGRSAAVPARERIDVVVPPWRRDLALEVDLIEEIARLDGYERLAASLPAGVLPAYRPQPTRLRDGVRALLAANGLQEAVTHALVSPAQAALHAEPDGLLGAALAASEGGPGGEPAILRNALSADHDRLRQSLLPSLLERALANQRYGAASGALFEVGRGYGVAAEGPREWTRLGIVAWGARQAARTGAPAVDWDLDEVKRLLATVAASLALGPIDYGAAPALQLLHPGRAARISGEGIAGLVGELHPALEGWRDAPRVLLAEVAISGLAGGSLRVARADLPPATAPISRDLALLLPDGAAVGALVALAREHVPGAVSIELFDLFAGGSLAAGERSAGLRFTFQPAEPGSDAGAADALERFAGVAARQLGARLRGEQGR